MAVYPLFETDGWMVGIILHRGSWWANSAVGGLLFEEENMQMKWTAEAACEHVMVCWGADTGVAPH